MRRTVLIITSEMLPGFGLPTAGGGLRALSLGEGLRLAGHEVVFSIPRKTAEQVAVDHPERAGLLEASYVEPNLADAVHRAAPDVVIVEQWEPLTRLDPVDCPVVVDLPGPLLLENRYRRLGDTRSNIASKIRALSRADAFCYSNPRQKGYWAAWLTLAGADPDHGILFHVPISRSPAMPPLPPADGPERFLYGGIFWPWQDPTLALSVLAEVLERSPRASLEIFGGRHPQHTLESDVYYAIPEKLEHHPRISFRPMMPLEALEAEYAKGGIALELAAPNLERELASTIRTIGFLWCGLPLIVNSYSYLAPEVAARGAGWVVDPTRPDSLRKVFQQALADRTSWPAMGKAAQALVAERFTWDRAVKELEEFVQSPRRREAGGGFLQETRDRMRELEDTLLKKQEEIDQLNREMCAKLALLEDAHGRLQKRLRSRIARSLRRLMGAGG